MRIGDNIASEFNEFSVNYTRDMTKCVPHYINLIDAFVNDLPKGFLPKTLLDLGCGNGNVTSHLLQLFPNSKYVLVDASEEMISLCKQRFKGHHVQYVTSYFEDFKFKSNAIDMITAGFSLHHVDSENKKDLFKKIYQSLLTGGIFGYSDLMIDKNKPEHSKLLEDWKAFVYRNFPDGEKWEWLMEHYEQFDKPNDSKDQIKWLQQAGFKNIETSVMEKYWVHIRAIKD